MVIQSVVNFDGIFFDFQSPIRNSTQFWGESKQRDKIVGFHIHLSAVDFYIHRCDAFRTTKTYYLCGCDEFYFSSVFEFLYFFYRIQSATKFISSMHQGHFRGHIRQEDTPVQGGVAPSRNHDFLVAVFFGVFDEIIHPSIILFIEFDVFEQGFSGFKCTQTSGNGNGFGLVLCALVGGYNEATIVKFFNGFGSFAQGKSGLKLFDLFHEIFDQVACQNLRITWNIVNRFFGIQLSQLSSGLR